MQIALTMLVVIGTLVVLVSHPLGAQGAVIHADAAPLWGSSVRLVQAGSVGTIDGPPEYAFGSIDMVVAEKGGGFSVFDSKDVQIRRYNAAGKFIGNIGGKGAGPGEYQEILGLGLLGDTALVTWDPRSVRVTFFGLDGKVRSSFRPALGSMVYGSDVFGVDNSGNVSIQISFGGKNQYIRYRANGAVLDTLTSVLDNADGFVLMTSDGARRSFGTSQLVKPSPLGGLITASTDTLGFAMTVGGKQLRVRRSYIPVRLAAAERKEWEDYAEFFFVRGKAQRSQPGVQFPEPVLAKIPAIKPALRDLTVDRDGRVWLDVYTVAEKRPIPPRPSGDQRPQLTWRERSNFDVFAPTGQYLGRVVLPAEYQLLDARGDRIWTLCKGPDDEERIVIFQIVRK